MGGVPTPFDTLKIRTSTYSVSTKECFVTMLFVVRRRETSIESLCSGTLEYR